MAKRSKGLCVIDSGVLKTLLAEARAALEQADPDFAAELLPKEWPSAVARRSIRELARGIATNGTGGNMSFWKAAAEAYLQHRFDPEEANLILTLHDDVREALETIRDYIVSHDEVNEIIDRQHPGRKLPMATILISALVFAAALATEQ